MAEKSILVPGSALVDGCGDEAFLAALLDVELAWVKAQHREGLIGKAELLAAAAACAAESWSVGDISDRVANGGNPVIPLLDELRNRVATHLPVDADLGFIHWTLTSQDVFDSAMLLVAKRVVGQILADLNATRAALVALTSSKQPMLARTLSRSAGRTTFGYKAARWAQAISESAEQLIVCANSLPLSFGGAAGNLAALLAGTKGNAAAAFALISSWADELDLAQTVLPWHTGRFPVQRLAASLAECSISIGKIANDLVLLNRDEIAELAEPEAPGRGASSSMAHKRNPVMAIMIRRAALAAPHLLSQVFTGAALSDDERADVGWHLEWEPLMSLLRDAAISARLGAELAAGMQINEQRMAQNLESFEFTVGRESRPGAEPALIERFLARYGDLEGETT